MSAPNSPPCLFLSHSGADTDAARELKRRLLDSPDARAAGLRVWFDKDDLAAGAGWQAQLRPRAKLSKRPGWLERLVGAPLGHFHTKSALRTAASWSVKCTSSH
jgi:hypothetical protein